MRILSSVTFVIGVLVFALTFPSRIWSQNQEPANGAASATAGSIAGSVHDSSGALIPGATVAITNDRGLTQSVVTDEHGDYSLAGLPPSAYTVTVSAQGFDTFTSMPVTLAAGQNARVDATLQISAATASVHVQGQNAGQVETETPQMSGTLTQQEVTSIGLNGRNFTQLITLAPGVSNQTGQDEALVGMKGSVKYSVNGGRVEYNNFDIDGSDVLNAGINGSQSTLIVYPSLDAINDVTVLTSNYGAQYGRSASGTVLVTTKTGGPQFHGDLYEFARNEIFNAKGFFDPGDRQPLYRRHDFGYTFGGPVFIPGRYNTQKDKTFFFFSQEFRIEKTPTDFNQGVPSVEERNGNFSDVCPFTPPSGNVVFTRTQFPDCPAAGTEASGVYFTFPGNQVPIDPNAAAILSTGVIPAPTSTVGCNSTIRSCYAVAVSTPTNWREELFRIDHNFTPNVRWTTRFIHDQWSTVTTVPQWGYIANSFPTVESNFVGPGLDVVTHVTQIVSPTFVNDFVFSFTTDHIALTDLAGPGVTTLSRSQLGLTMGSLFSCPLAFPATSSSACFGDKIPGIVIAGTNAAYGGAGFAVDPSFEPYHHSNPTYAFGDGSTKTIGNHNLQFGAQVVIAQKNEVNPAIGATLGDVQGLLGFSNVNSVFSTGNAFADFLEGKIRTFQQDSGQAKYYNRYTTVEPYIQDDWHFSNQLTINLGLRLSLFGTWHELNQNGVTGWSWEASAFNPALAATAVVDPFGSGTIDLGGELLRVSTCQDPANPSITTCDAVPLNPASPDPVLTNGLVQCGTHGLSSSCMTGHLFNPAPRIGFAWSPHGDNKTSIRAGYGIFFEHGTGNEANTGSLEGSAPIILDETQRNISGYANIGLLSSAMGTGGFPPAFPLNVTAIPTHAVWPYVQQWSLSVQRQMTPDLVGTVAYVGSKGTHLTAALQINQLAPTSNADNPFLFNEPITTAFCDTYSGSGGSATFTLPDGASIPATPNLLAACYGVPGAQKQFPDPNSLRTFAPTLGQIYSLENVANSHYDALQITLRRTKAPLSLELAYSYSHSTDDSSDRFDSTFVNSFNLASNRASSNFDQRHLLNVSYVYDLSFTKIGSSIRNFFLWRETPIGDPSAHGKPGAPASSGSSWVDTSWIGRHFLQQWQLSGVTTYQSGTPFSVINGGSNVTGISVLDNAGIANGTGAGSYADVAPVTGGGLIPNAGEAPFTFGPLLGNPNRFAAPRGLTFGDTNRNFFVNPSRLNFDMALLKHFKITESATLELRGEAFNIFNTTQFRIYNPDKGNQANNIISCYGGQNNLAGYVDPSFLVDNVGINCLEGNSFLRPIDAHRPRTIQLGIKILF